MRLMRMALQWDEWSQPACVPLLLLLMMMMMMMSLCLHAIMQVTRTMLAEMSSGLIIRRTAIASATKVGCQTFCT
jgi:hypothetical protein